MQNKTAILAVFLCYNFYNRQYIILELIIPFCRKYNEEITHGRRRTMTLSKINSISGEITLPGDKSISHRAIMLASIGEGKSIIKNFLRAEDTLSTINAFRSLGIEINQLPTEVIVEGKGLYGLKEPLNIIDAGNSGTTIRLLSGILAGQEFFTVVTGDSSLRSRPMARIITPLSKMGARIEGRDNGRLAPLAIRGGSLQAIEYQSPIPSAQVKSAILLAGLYASGETKVTEDFQSRDHTERMLRAMGGKVKSIDNTVTIQNSTLYGDELVVPGDISSASFFIVAAAAMVGAKLILRDVGLNPSRSGIIDIIKAMGGKIYIDNLRVSGGEEIGDIIVEGCKLHGVTITEEIIPRLIDEVPIIAVAAALAEGTTIINGAEELKFKESNRIAAMVTELKKVGVNIKELPDGMIIEGPNKIKGATVESYNDHRIAMALAICDLFSEGEIQIKNSNCIAISFPDFYDKLKEIIR